VFRTDSRVGLLHDFGDALNREKANPVFTSFVNLRVLDTETIAEASKYQPVTIGI
jgi:hypothetical protein